MSNSPTPEQTPSSAPAPDAPSGDVTGQDRLAWNVFVSWAGQTVFIVAGFILPRMIDNNLGRAGLGVWDFSWSLVAYLNLVQGGVVSAVNRFVAKFKAVGDIEGVNRAVSSVFVMLLSMGVLVMVLSCVLAAIVPGLLAGRLAEHASEAQAIVLLLGFSVALQMMSSTFGGVITGCHRWDLQNLILAGGHVLVTIGIIIALLMGGGLVALAGIVLAGEALRSVARCGVAKAVFPQMRVRLKLARRRTALNMLTFGSKTLLPTIGDLLSNQTVSILVISFMGAPALALYTRPRSLLRHGRTLVSKFAMVLIPTATSLQTLGAKDKLTAFFVDSSRYGAYLTFPIVALVAIGGGPLLQFWMGPEYARAGLAAVLALGHLAFLLSIPAEHVLVGINAHGRPGLAKLISSVVGAGLVALALGPLKLGLVGAAAAIGIQLTLTNGVYLPVYACRRLDLGLGRFLRSAFLGPLLCVIPFAACLVAGQVIFPQTPWKSLAFGTGVGGIVLAVLYWRVALPSGAKSRIKAKLGLQRVAEESDEPTDDEMDA